MTGIVLVGVLAGTMACVIAPPRAAAQSVSSAATGPDAARRERAIRVARDIIRAARFAALITQDPSTGSAARTIDPAPPDSAMVVRFVTNPRSRKVRQLARDARVTLYYFDAKGMRYAAISGISREVREAAKKEALWYAEWTPFYPQRERGAALFEVVPQRLEVVSEGDGVVGDSVTWAVPVVRFRPKGVRR
ncbi:MAG: pyridoxamine 5'-phosphate oxidase family protein [Gemmatimonadetes bacterium]|nr:pyridoxamine 5'-phosphate oxidase family protein [Gemmatimonadota bacterium]